ncbi:hypothetical protein DFH06DRAFT_1142102 [Mycena polygramma]|nr:hypothetical protein DFH06DRAFT_1142102 [Mycena polygramma]
MAVEAADPKLVAFNASIRAALSDSNLISAWQQAHPDVRDLFFFSALANELTIVFLNKILWAVRSVWPAKFDARLRISSCFRTRKMRTTLFSPTSSPLGQSCAPGAFVASLLPLGLMLYLPLSNHSSRLTMRSAVVPKIDPSFVLSTFTPAPNFSHLDNQHVPPSRAAQSSLTSDDAMAPSPPPACTPASEASAPPPARTPASEASAPPPACTSASESSAPPPARTPASEAYAPPPVRTSASDASASRRVSHLVSDLERLRDPGVLDDLDDTDLKLLVGALVGRNSRLEGVLSLPNSPSSNPALEVSVPPPPLSIVERLEEPGVLDLDHYDITDMKHLVGALFAKISHLQRHRIPPLDGPAIVFCFLCRIWSFVNHYLPSILTYGGVLIGRWSMR